MQNLPKVSVIIPTYNSSQYIRQAVESALAQTYANVEIIVVDDGSTDDTARVLEPYLDQIRYIVQLNSGPAAARNRAVRESTGELLAFLDADDMWLPHKLTRQVECFTADPTVGLVHSDILCWDTVSDRVERRERHRRQYVGHCYHSLVRGNSVMISTVVVRRECFEIAGRFDQWIRNACCEDYDLWIRVSRHFAFGYVDEPLIIYRLHASNASSNSLVMSEGSLFVIEKAFEADPELWSSYGRIQSRRRLFHLMFTLGYVQFDLGDFAAAQRTIGRALRVWPLNAHALALYVAAFAPPPLVRYARSFKQQFGRGVTCAPSSPPGSV